MNRTPAHTLSDDDVRQLRARSQQLAGPRARTPLDAVTRLVGVQAQDSRAAALGMRARSDGLDAKTLDTSIRNRSIVRTWAMRGTLHMLAAGDVHWIAQLCGPRYVAKYRRARLALGLTDTLLERVINALPAVLRSSVPITRTALVDRLSDAGVKIDPKGQASAHLVVVASLMGILCCGPDTVGGKSTYVLLEEWVPRQIGKPKDPVAELATRYLAGHGPASVTDFAAWSGLPTTEARDAIARVSGNFEGCVIQGQHAWFQATTASAGHFVRLLGGFDAYLLAYRRRGFALDQRYQAQVHPGGGIIRPVVLVDGRVAGVWRLHDGEIAVACFGSKRYGLEREAREVTRFVADLAALEQRSGVTGRF